MGCLQDVGLAGEAFAEGEAALMRALLELAGQVEVGVAFEHVHGAATTDALACAGAAEG